MSDEKADLYPWNTRLKVLKRRLRDYAASWHSNRPLVDFATKQGPYSDEARDLREREKNWLDTEVYCCIHDFQPAERHLVMKWANEAGIGPGFVVD